MVPTGSRSRLWGTGKKKEWIGKKNDLFYYFFFKQEGTVSLEISLFGTRHLNSGELFSTKPEDNKEEYNPFMCPSSATHIFFFLNLK